MTLVSVLIGTRDRPDELARCLPTVLANDYPDFEVIVVDQSEAEAGEGVVEALADPRLRYHRQQHVGKSRALNAALGQAKGEIIALTDDDCVVPSDWLRRAVAVLTREPEAGIIFGKLVAAPHDPREAFVPTFLPRRYRRLRGRLASAVPRMGVGANMFVRRPVIERLGGFDECLGPGSRFRGGNDTDLAHRALRAGFAVVQDPDNVVVHWGKRSYADGSARRLLRNNYYGTGARLVKQLRCGDPLAAYTLLRDALGEAARLIASVIRHRRGTGVGRLFYLMLGASRGLRQPVDHKRWLYLPTGDWGP